ncbi:putative Costars domain-containing protein [Helianthus annuus]|nr:putative Costars domain-containing protein [Helianthus annuus]KAJ0459647.1 putative Costars domain-containing protein [Helianthus annuus]
MNVEEEVEKLKVEIQRLGTKQEDGSYKVTFGVLFNDDRCANIFEALVGTLRAAKRRKLLTYDALIAWQNSLNSHKKNMHRHTKIVQPGMTHLCKDCDILKRVHRI